MEGPLEADIPRSACLARIGGRLLIEIDFGTGPVSNPLLSAVVRADGGRDVVREKTNANEKDRPRGGPRNDAWRRPELSNFISVQLRVGLLGAEAVMLTPNSHGRLLAAVAGLSTSATFTHAHTRTYIYTCWLRQYRPLPYRNFLLACWYVDPLTRIMVTAWRLVTFYSVHPSDRLQRRFMALRTHRLDSLPPAIRNCAPNCVNKSCFSLKDLRHVSQRKS